MENSEGIRTQKQIFLLISKHPGLNLSAIAKMLNISLPLALYHLRYLEKHELITSSKEGASQRYYLHGEVGSKDRKYLSLFRKKIELEIVLILLKKPYLLHKDIAEYLSISPPLLTYYLKKLLKKNIIAYSGDGHNPRYYVVNESEIVAVLIKYEPYKIFDGISDTWTNFDVR